MKRVISMIVVLTIIMCMPTFVYGTDQIEPLWENTHSVYATINFNGTKGTFTASIIGYDYATDVHLMAWLYYKDSNGNWVEQTAWGGLSTTHTLALSKNFTAVSGVEYKVDYTVFVYTNLVYDEINFTVTKTCP